MVKRTLLVVAVLSGVAWLARPGQSEAQDGQVTGMFSDMRYSDGSGDVSGREIFIVGANDGYFAVVQIAEGMPGTPVVVPVEVDGNRIKFTMPGRIPEIFEGRVTSSRLEGRLESGKLSIRRSKSYWQ
jgi:hypothetical protein